MQIAGSKEEPMEHKVHVVDLFDGLMKNLELTKQADL